VIKSKHIDIFLTMLVLLMGAKGNIIAISDLLLVFSFCFSFIVFFKRNKSFPRAFKIFTIIYLLLTLLYFYKFGWINFTSSLRVYIKVITGVMVIILLDLRFFVYLEKLIVILAFISLPLYAFQLVDYELLKSFIGLVENNFKFLDYRSGWYVNNIVYTLNDNAMLRNSGFTWEPKGFANLLALATIINLLMYRFKLNRSIIILFIALLTTLSTAGFIIFFVFIPFFIYQQKNNLTILNILKLIFILIIAVPIFSLEFMSDKIINEVSYSENNLKYISAKTNNETVSLGRFGSMALAFIDFPANPIFGIGMQDRERTQAMYTRLVWVNGLADFLSRFGLFGIVFLLYSYSKSIRIVLKSCGVTKGSYTILLIFLSIFFASAVIIQPLFFAFQFYFLTKKNNEKIYSYSNSC